MTRAMASICVHRAPRTPLACTPGHIDSRDGTDLCPSSAANPSRQRSRAHPLARCFAGRSPNCHGPATHGPQSPVSARTLKFLQFICHGNRHSTGLQGISARAMAPICVHRAPRTPLDSAPGHIGSRDVLQEDHRNCQMMFAGRTPKITDRPDYIQEGHGPVYRISFTSL